MKVLGIGNLPVAAFQKAVVGRDDTAVSAAEKSSNRGRRLGSSQKILRLATPPLGSFPRSVPSTNRLKSRLVVTRSKYLPQGKRVVGVDHLQDSIRLDGQFARGHNEYCSCTIECLGKSDDVR